jgi:hypothetical protein
MIRAGAKTDLPHLSGDRRMSQPSNPPAEPSLPAGSERRQAVRINPQLVFRCRVVPAQGEQMSAAVLDLSTSGAGLLVKGTLSAGETITVWFARHLVPPLDVAARVIYCKEQGENLSVAGCEFLAALDDADMQAVLF